LKKSKKSANTTISDIIIFVGIPIISFYLAYNYSSFIVDFLGFMVLLLACVLVYEQAPDYIKEIWKKIKNWRAR
jgi:hypothetical protein